MRASSTGIVKRPHLLAPLAFGIHYRVSKELEVFFEEHVGHSSFFFYEFFLEHAITRWERFEEVLLSRQAVTAPFLSRVVSKTGFIPALDVDIVSTLRTRDDIQSIPVTRTALQKYWRDLDTMRFQIADTELLRLLVEHWLAKESQGFAPYSTPGSEVHVDGNGIAVHVGGLSTSYLRNEYPQSIIDRARNDPASREAAVAKLREYELVLRPWLRSAETSEIAIAATSISSKAIFWGECIVIAPFMAGENAEKRPSWLEKLNELLRDHVRHTYVPMLALLENYIHEVELQAELRTTLSESKTHSVAKADIAGVSKDWLSVNQAQLRRIGTGKHPTASEETNTFLDSTPSTNLFLCLLLGCTKQPVSEGWGRLTKLEKSLVKLWADRLSMVLQQPIAVNESLIFVKYLIASPAMVNRTCAAMALSHASDTGAHKRTVKTALVIGGPGSGKDSMAQLIRLFSPGYRFGPTTTLNMAMFRPKQVAVPLLLGLQTQYQMGDSRTDETKDFVIKGILDRALADAIHRSKVEGASTAFQGETERGFTFILDELNSLDMDTQGALLRLLENGELQPLGALGSEPDGLNILIVGVMNEEPHLIMKRRAMERVIRDKQLFGGVLGEVLYEMFRNQRRLRDDLYYRLIRGGEIHLPDLRDRQEDIPILFYFIVSTELKAQFPEGVEDKWEIELSVYEALIDPPYEWPGNLRELQTVARRILGRAVEEWEELCSSVQTFRITGAHAKSALSEHRRVAGAESGIVADSRPH